MHTFIASAAARAAPTRTATHAVNCPGPSANVDTDSTLTVVPRMVCGLEKRYMTLAAVAAQVRREARSVTSSEATANSAWSLLPSSSTGTAAAACVCTCVWRRIKGRGSRRGGRGSKRGPIGAPRGRHVERPTIMTVRTLSHRVHTLSCSRGAVQSGGRGSNEMRGAGAAASSFCGVKRCQNQHPVLFLFRASLRVAGTPPQRRWGSSRCLRQPERTRTHTRTHNGGRSRRFPHPPRHPPRRRDHPPLRRPARRHRGRDLGRHRGVCGSDGGCRPAVEAGGWG